MKTFLLLCLASLLASSAFANTNVRTWTLEDGSSLYAELVNYDDEADRVHLRIREKEDAFRQLADFSPIDQAWLVEWLEIGERLNAKLEEIPGTYTHYNWQGELGSYDFYVYEPSSVVGSSTRPLMILFSPGKNGRRFLLRHIDAAEATGMVIVTLDRFGNTRDVESWEAQKHQFFELFPQIERTVPHNPSRLFAGGTSGGALQAFRKTWQVARPWAGVYSNGGWLGPTDDLEPSYPALRVAVVNGNNDRAANHYLPRDQKILQDNGSTVSVISFEGAHQVPPPETMTKAWDWLLDQGNIIEVDG